MKSRNLVLILSLSVSSVLPGCSVGVVPMPASRVQSAKMAEQPLLRGADAPGAFKHLWDFSGSETYLFNPAEVSLKDGAARLKAGEARPRQATLVTSAGPPYVALDSFAETTGPSHRGKVLYQLSHNDSSWYYVRKGQWVNAGPSAAQANTASEVREHIGSFHSQVGMGSLYLKVFLISPTGKETVELRGIMVEGILPRAD